METLFPKVSISLEESSIDPRALFENAKDIWLEVGFGGGEHLAWHAEQNRDVGFLGCEPFINGVAKLVSEIDEKKLANVRIHADDARFLLTRLEPGSLARVFILYPDPWPKSRHNKRRFVNDETLALIEAALREGGELRFASDIPDYVAWTLAHIRRFNETAQSRLEWLAESPADWRERPADWPQTRYEEKARREGRQPGYLTFRKKGLQATCEKPGKSAI
ncbi:MAG: tRNA (guanosine(46)-N7)-methyltransferase TrmB [Parvibaculum sp.]|uniref:tRNA (guanosine(46)-N7)-methyltransferase TrmB n=1 Tax=Parvibaculum sp. TaxID=2024848 RepID=UPI00283B8EC7|nr:tRNA (guanosine(46)-N7)-methyltransferase TrmB [Parvibaculum sp.]MDR3500736.1 tRNA (guanosine(46)-N7)-methyltransferase TrmB [Parvibaculum sp.]